MAELTEKELFQRVDLTHSADREKIAAPSLNFLQDSWRRLTKNKGALVSLFIILVIVLLAVLAPVIAPFDPLEQNTEFANLPARIPGIFNGYRNGFQKASTSSLEPITLAVTYSLVCFTGHKLRLLLLL